MTGRIASVDCETTGLDPARHTAWDIAIALGDGTKRQWFIKPNLATADPMALRIGRYYERTADLQASGSRKQGPKWADPDKTAAEIARLLNGATLLGHNPSFDAAFIAAFLRRHGHILTADHHLIDTGTLVTGFMAGLRQGTRLALRPDGGLPASVDLDALYPAPKGKHLADVARAVGVDPMKFEQHTALGDAHLALATYSVVMGGTP
jgi:DNA polymerase III epsilon subunit-like protein